MSWWKRLFSSDVSSAQRNAGFDGAFNDRLRLAATNLTSAAARQSDAVHETMASITEIRSMISQTDAQVNRSLSLTEDTRHNGVERMKIIERLQRAMDAIKESNQLLNDLQNSFQVIHSKTRVINDIVSKTKLLSFNASIEAARAGQFGKGFSVVAEEVGRLAQSSGAAAKEIEHLVMESQTRATSVVEMVISRANEGVSVTREVKQSFTELSSAIAEISLALTQISQASREQTVGIERTTSSIERISHATQMNQRSAQEVMRLAETNHNIDSELGRPQPAANAAIDDLVRHLTPNTPAAPVTGLHKVTADDPSFKPQE